MELQRSLTSNEGYHAWRNGVESVGQGISSERWSLGWSGKMEIESS